MEDKSPSILFTDQAGLMQSARMFSYRLLVCLERLYYTFQSDAIA